MTPTAALLAEIAEVGRDAVRGGYSRPGLGPEELALRSWFLDHAAARGLEAEVDANGVTWAWWLPEDGSREGAVATGSHLDSVPGGGTYDGPLGVVSALRAHDLLRETMAHPPRALALVVWPEEEGSRFGVPCLGSRLAVGAVTPQKVRSLVGRDGTGFDEAARIASLDPELIGPRPEALAQLSAFVELHVEQGRGLADHDQPVAIGRSILAHGRWHVSIRGRGDHAGTTLMADRADPVLVAADVVRAVRAISAHREAARGTVGRMEVIPGGTNVIASQVDLWFDLRHAEEGTVREILERITAAARAAAVAEGCELRIREESFSPQTVFDAGLRDRLESVLPDAPVLDTGAGHDAGVLAEALPTAMLFVRNPTGTSHAPAEGASDEDAEAGSAALARVLADLLATPTTPAQ